MRYIYLLFFLSCQPLLASQYPIKIGSETVLIKKFQHGIGKNYIHVHQNETTALQAAKAVIRDEGGSVLTLCHSGGRNISFNMDGRRYEFDPNRIFTDKGIKTTLSQYGRYSPKAHQEVRKLADKIISLLPLGKIIAVHNNRFYSFKNYLPGHDAATDAQSIHIANKKHYRNFYLVTRKADFLRLKRLGFNEVLQKATPKDDGSLSVYLAGRTYVNVEAGFNELEAQIKMLKYA